MTLPDDKDKVCTATGGDSIAKGDACYAEGVHRQTTRPPTTGTVRVWIGETDDGRWFGYLVQLPLLNFFGATRDEVLAEIRKEFANGLSLGRIGIKTVTEEDVSL